MAKAAATAEARLADIEVVELSLVDRGANKRPLLIVKSAEGGQPSDPAAPAAPASEAPTAPITPEQAAADATAAPTPPVTPAPLEPTQQQTDELALEEVDKAKWSTKYVNDLPDSSFLYIESGGKKDADGKTTPRSLRHFPVKDADGTVDLPHVRNALARIPQADLPDTVKQQCKAKAEKLLEQASKKEKTKKGEGETDDPPAEDVAKRGAKMRKERLSRFKAALAELHKIESELEQVIEEEERDSGKVNKGDADEPNPLQAQVDDLTKQIGSLTADKAQLEKDIAEQKGIVAKQAARLKDASISPPPNSVTPEGVAKKDNPVIWPTDLNAARGK